MNVNAIFQNTAILITFDGNTHCIDDSNPNYDQIFEHLKNKDYESAKSLCELTFEIINWGDEELTVQGGEITFLGKSLGDSFTRRVLQMMDENQDREPLKKFLSKLFKNPSNRSIEQTPHFLYACDLPITKDGNILAYKKIRKDYTDCYSGTIDNHPGAVVKEDRRLISDDPHIMCHKGLHVCSFDYLRSFRGERMVVCEISPENIVAVPVDHHRTKMRVCEYKVLEELEDFENVDPRDIYERESVWSVAPEKSELEEDDYYDEEEFDVESDAEQRHVFREKAKSQPRDVKGHFIKIENKEHAVELFKEGRISAGTVLDCFGFDPNQKVDSSLNNSTNSQLRDKNGRFMSKGKNCLGGSN